MPGTQGGPRIEIDLGEVRRWARNCPTQDELAVAIGCSLSTIEHRMGTDPELREAWEAGKAEGRHTFRRKIWTLANSCSDLKPPAGAHVMAIYLSKQPLSKGGLGFSDRLEAVVEVAARPDYTQLSDEELETLLALTRKAKPE